jgi:3-oxoacyl-[acyl-carrier protein] reductase
VVLAPAPQIRLTAEGARVAICARTKEKLHTNLEAIEEVGGRGVMITCDVANPDGGRGRLVARTEEALGPIDYLVYVAASGSYAKFEDVTLDQVQLALEVNVKAPWLLLQDAVASMREGHRGGAIVNIGTRRQVR